MKKNHDVPNNSRYRLAAIKHSLEVELGREYTAATTRANIGNYQFLHIPPELVRWSYFWLNAQTI